MKLQQCQMGEPFALMGKRLYFASWYHIRPAGFGWFDEEGVDVSVMGNLGPDEAEFHKFDRPYGIRLASQPAERTRPVLKREKPWEQNRITWNTVLKDGDLYKAWCDCGAAQVRNDMALVENFFCYLESKDGMHWNRPELKEVRFGRVNKTNILDTKGGMVFIDPAARPAERFKWVNLADISRKQFEAYKRLRPDAWDLRALRPDVAEWSEKFPEGMINAIVGAVSPDGIHWKNLARPLAVEHSDTQIVCYYDELLEKYVYYTRYWPRRLRVMNGHTNNHTAPVWISERRSIGRAETSDFRNFPLSQSLLEPSPDMGPSDVFYTNCRTSIPGAPDQHLMFPTVWSTANDSTSIVMYSSHDGANWQRVPGGPVFGTGDFGAWDGGCVFAQPNLLELPDGSFVLPYTGYNVPHKYPRGQFEPHAAYARWPQGRLVALVADEYGEFSTYAMVNPGRRMHLNVRTRRGGSVKVEVVGMDRKVLPGRSFEECRPIFGDRAKALVTWESGTDLGYAEGVPVYLRFRLDQAELFSLEFDA